MYPPPHFLENDDAKLATLIRENAFGALVSVVDGRATATHIPFLYDQEAGVLLGHVARANPQWGSLDQAQDVLVIFQGPHAYVSPSWYNSPGVPTWNYAIVHIHGIATTFDAPERLHALVSKLTDQYESSNEEPWSGQYNPRMLENIVGIEIHISSIEGKFKLSQNRPLEDREAVSSKLIEIDGSEAQKVAEMMRKNEI
jgi:transcriptional regulator